MEKREIKISKTARYFQIGHLSERTKEIWFVLHGYGQLASFFLKWFEPIDDGSRLIVAPEGLHRFYWEGFSGKVVASWMTKEERISDISDYIDFLDAVYAEVAGDTDYHIRVFGFSQGTATACRWALNGTSAINSLILWAGAFPHDLDYSTYAQRLNEMDIKVLIGDEDRFITLDQAEEHKKEMEAKGVNFELIKFSGGHKVYDDPLISIV